MFEVKFKLKKNSKYQVSFLLSDSQHETKEEATIRVNQLMKEHPFGTEIFVISGKGDAEKFIVQK